MWRNVWRIAVQTYKEWQARGCAQLAAALAFYGILAFGGAALIGVYVAAALRTSGRFDLSRRAGSAGGHADASIVGQLVHAAQMRHDTWIALAIGIALFLFGVVVSALLLQDGLNRIWECDRNKPKDAVRHAPEFAAMLLLSLLLAILLFAGAGIHALVNRTHRVTLATGILYQGADVIASIAVLTLVFFLVLAYIAPVRSRWRKVWFASLLSAVLYERGQFGLAFYVGQMDPRSPYADIGALIAVILWILYSAEVVYVGAVLTKVLAGTQAAASGRRSASGSRRRR